MLSFLLLIAALGLLLPTNAVNAATSTDQTKMILPPDTLKDKAAAAVKDFKAKSGDTKATVVAQVVADSTPLIKNPATGDYEWQLPRGTVLRYFYEKGNFFRVMTQRGTYGYVDKTQVALTDGADFFSYAVGGCKVTQTYVYDDLSTSSTELFPLIKGDRMSVLFYLDGYYIVSVAEEVGCVPASQIDVWIHADINDSNYVLAEAEVNVLTYVYKSLSTTSAKLLTLNPGNTITVRGNASTGFYKVLTKGKTGYVPKKYVSINDGLINPYAPEIKTINTTGRAISACSIYKGMSTTSTVLKSLSNGATFTVFSVCGSFFKVKSGSVTGYIPTQYVKVLNQRTVSAVGVVKNQSYIHTTIYTASPKILTLEAGARVAVLKVYDNFYKVSVSGVTGCMSMEDIRVE